MKKNSRIRFNPVTKEIEVEGSELFVKTYFNKLQAMISGPSQKTVTIKKEPRAVKPTIAKKVKKTRKKAPAEKKVTHIDAVVSLIQGAPEGISTAELKTKTGLNERQIWSIINRASKQGMIQKIKRGIYSGVVAVEASEEPKVE
ncbi:MAG: hypothetical protein KJ936_06740 [Proteobacteria bacterium]|nr:hypothetical protein [Pseudomonadota bacterium]